MRLLTGIVLRPLLTFMLPLFLAVCTGNAKIETGFDYETTYKTYTALIDKHNACSVNADCVRVTKRPRCICGPCGSGPYINAQSVASFNAEFDASPILTNVTCADFTCALYGCPTPTQICGSSGRCSSY